MSYRNDREWSDKYIPQIKQIIGPHLLGVSSFEVDAEQATDLIVLTGRNMMIACRLRRPGYEKYIGQFTIRSRRDTGASTELKKVIDGWGDWMFYGHANEAGVIHAWMIIDFKSFRAHLLRHFATPENKRVISTGDQSNGDGTYFQWFEADTFPPVPPLLIARKGLDG
jgi:hypothetical protein